MRETRGEVPPTPQSYHKESTNSSLTANTGVYFLILNHDVRLLSLTAIKGWKSQHWFIWRVLSPSGPFQALTKITEKDQQDQ